MVLLSAVAETTGAMAVACSFMAGIHQLYLGYCFEGADGFSPILLLGWLLGDVCNVLGTYWTHQLMFQRVIAIASLLNDVALAAQHVYYKRKHGRLHAVPDPVPMGPGRFLAIQWNGLLRPYILFTLVSAARAQPLKLASHETWDWASCGAWLLGGSEDGDEGFIDWEFLAGQCFAWTATLSYAFALVPQVLENFARKSTGSVAISMFLADAVSSTNYLATIFITAYEKTSHRRRVDFVLEELPYIVGMALCALMDCVLLAQYFFYPQFIVEATIDTRSATPFVYTETSTLQPIRSWKSYRATDLHIHRQASTPLTNEMTDDT